jgi:heme-degrading monooxygenase HmoA
MFAVIFDVYPRPERYDDYLALAGLLRPDLEGIDGFLSVERLAARGRPGWILSLSLWRDEAALVRWRTHGRHREAQERGRREIFQDYRLRVGRVIADAIPGQAGRGPDRRAADDDRHAQRPAVVALLEVEPEEGAQIDLPALTGVGVEDLDGFLGSDQFDSIYVQGKVLSRSSWRDETAARAWQTRVLEHVAGRALAVGPTVRARLGMVAIERDYGMFERAQAPQ